MEAAYAELARRVLWYLGCPSCHGLYMPDQVAGKAMPCHGKPCCYKLFLFGKFFDSLLRQEVSTDRLE
eukprot:4362428-Amphidinium_carterae.1